MDYHDRKVLTKELSKDVALNGAIFEFIRAIPDVSLSLQQWSSTCSDALQYHFGITTDNIFEFKRRMKGFTMSQLKLEPANKYFNKNATVKHNIPITTIHQVKGASLDAMLCFFAERAGKESITFSDFARPNGFPTERQRMIYVACSRPSQFLAMAFPSSIEDRKLKQHFGSHIDIVNL